MSSLKSFPVLVFAGGVYQRQIYTAAEYELFMRNPYVADSEVVLVTVAEALAAPDMLEALKEAVRLESGQYDGLDSVSEVARDMIDKAIVKAEGGAS